MKETDVEIFTDPKTGKKWANVGLLRGLRKFTVFTLSGGYGDDPGGKSNSINADWWGCVTKMGAWYQSNIHTYQGTTTKGEALKGKKFYQCPLIGTNVADDCSGFVKACLQAFGVKDIDDIWVTTAAMQPGSKFDQALRAAGFTYMAYAPDIVSAGDIICGGPSSHTEIYAGVNGGRAKSYSWGNIHDGKSTRGQKNPQGMPCGFCKMNYRHIWRKT